MQMLSNKKVLLPVLALVGVFVLLFILLVGGTVYAWTSNKNVPVFSSLVEVVEQATWDAGKSENELVSSMFSPFASIAADEDGKISNEELQKFFTEDSAVEVESYDYDITVYVQSEVPDGASTYEGLEGEITFNMKGDVSQKEEELLLNSEISVVYDAEGTQLKGEGELRIVDETLYGKADVLPTFGTTEFDQYQGQWYSQDISAYLDELYAAENEEEIDEEALEDLYQIITSDAILNNIEKMPDEVYGDVRTHCYRLDLDGNDIVELMKAYNEAMEDNDDFDADIDAFDQDEMDEAKDFIDRFMMEWCAGRRDNLPYKYVVELQVSDEEIDLTMRIDAKMSNYGKDVEVEKPSGAKTFETLYNELYPTPDYSDDYYYDDTYEYDYDYDYDFEDDYYFEY